MRDSFFYDVYIKIFNDGFWMGLLGVILWLLSLILVGLILCSSLYLIDSVKLKEKHGEGIVIEKWFEPAHTTTTYMLVGKVMIPQIHYYDDAWMAKIKINNVTDNVSFKKNYWYLLTMNQKVNCVYKKGRIFNTIYIENVSWVQVKK